MTPPRLSALLVATTCAVMTIACAPKQARVPGSASSKDATLVVLLPDPATGVVGRASASNKTGSADLVKAGDATLVRISKGPSRVKTMSQPEIEKQFGEVLSALPPPPQYFTLFFRFESDELTPESRALVPDVLKAVKDRPAPEVVVTGHTDTTGTAASNLELGMKRAVMVRALLVEAGLDAAAIETVSHGEAVLLVQTPDETYEARNRRVEITIR
jgi:outer membrane protein OmpA-like peptidoglycan-associated protein